MAENRQFRLEDIAEGKAEDNELYRELGRVQGIKDSVDAMLNSNGELLSLFIEDTHERDEETQR